MKVLHVIPSMSATHGGATRALELSVLALGQQGVEVETITTDDDGEGRLGLRSGTCQIRNGIALRYFPRLTRAYRSSPRLALWLLRHAREYDLVHVHALFSFAPVVAALICRWQHIPYVVEPLGVLNAYGLSQRRPRLKRLMLRLVEGPLLRSAGAVRFTSAQEAREAQRLGLPLSGHVIALGLPTPAPAALPGLDDPRLTPLRGRDFLLFLSRIDPKKNLEVLIEALGRLAEAGQATWLLVAGDGDANYVAALKTLARDCGVAERIVWAGYLDGTAKTAALVHAKAFVLPSHSENFCIAAVEALQAGLPCILSPGVAVAEEIAQAGAGMMVAPEALSVADAVHRIIGSPDRAHSMSAAGRRLATERFSTEPMGKALKALYEGVLTR